MRALCGAIITAGALIGLGLAGIGLGIRYQDVPYAADTYVRFKSLDTAMAITFVALVLTLLVGLATAFLGLAYHHERRHREHHLHTSGFKPTSVEPGALPGSDRPCRSLLQARVRDVSRATHRRPPGPTGDLRGFRGDELPPRDRSGSFGGLDPASLGSPAFGIGRSPMSLRFLAACVLLGTLLAPGITRGDGPPRRTESVIVVTLDGFRPQEFFGGADATLMDAKSGGVPDVAGLKARYLRETAEARREALLPFLWGTVAKKGQVFGDRSRGSVARLTNGKKFSYPGYNEIFCGFGDDRIDSNAKRPNPNLSVLEFLDEKPAFKGRVAAFCTWDVFPSIFRSAQNGLKVHAGWTPIVDEPLTDRQRLANLTMGHLPHYWPDNTFDLITMEAAREHMLRHRPRVMFIGLGETDEWAHGRRYDLYLASAHAADRYLDDLWRTLQSLPDYKDRTTLILTTRIISTAGAHRGSTGPATARRSSVREYMWIAVLGPDTPSLGVRERTEVTQGQVASTIAALLGEDFTSRLQPQVGPPPAPRRADCEGLESLQSIRQLADIACGLRAGPGVHLVAVSRRLLVRLLADPHDRPQRPVRLDPLPRVEREDVVRIDPSRRAVGVLRRQVDRGDRPVRREVLGPDDRGVLDRHPRQVGAELRP